MNIKGPVILLAALAGAGPINRVASDTQGVVVAVLSSDLAPYQEAFRGFQEAFGPVTVFNLAKEEPKIFPQTSVIVTFGGKAALKSYPDNATLIYCLAAGVKIKAGDRGPRAVKVYIVPRPAVLASRLKALQPSLSRLAILWNSEGFEDYVIQAKREFFFLGVKIVSERLADSDDLAARLRSLQGKVGALWLMP
ncbi:MAG: hypothetical protein AAB091_00195, partial [Elusimicrobiota bacterium]